MFITLIILQYMGCLANCFEFYEKRRPSFQKAVIDVLKFYDEHNL